LKVIKFIGRFRAQSKMRGKMIVPIDLFLYLIMNGLSEKRLVRSLLYKHPKQWTSI